MEKEDKVQGEKALKIKILKSRKRKGKKKVQGCFANVNDRSITVMTESSFQKIKAAAEVRQSQESENRLDNICSNIPSAFVPAQYGYHRSCYQRFTNVSRIMKRKKEAPNTSSEFGESSVKRRRVSQHSALTPSRLLPAHKCLFCDKGRIRKSGKEEHLVKCVTKIAEESIKRAAETKQDEFILLRLRILT